MPARFGSLQDRIEAWRRLLAAYPCSDTTQQILGAIAHGVLIRYDGPLRSTGRPATNLPMDAAGLSHVHQETSQRLREGRVTVVRGLEAESLLPAVNDSIRPEFVYLHYATLQPLLEFVASLPGCRLWKGDLRDAFRHIVTSLLDARLLGFSLDGVLYRENALTFGGKSSPFLFNLFAEMLHWVVAASCPYPLHHYLNDFFGAVPSTADPTQPVRLLSLACKALGFSLSPEKTLHSQTRLEILGIEIDSATQTVGITDTRCQRIRSVCSTLVSKSCVSLLELQQIAGLLQFVTQVAPHDRAYLSRIYSTLRRAHRSPCSPLQLPKPAVDELRWWSDLLSRWCGSSIITHSPLVATHIWSDVSLHALGGHLGSADATVTTFFRDVPRCHRKKNIRFLEALAVLDSLRAFLPHILALSASHVVLHVDNENVEHSLRSRHSHDPLTQTLLREIFGLCFMHNLRVVPVWVSSTDNVLADLLLRRRFSQIRRQFPAAHLQVFPPAAPTTSSQVPPLPASASLNAVSRHQYFPACAAYQAFCACFFSISATSLLASGTTLFEWIADLSQEGRTYHAIRSRLTTLLSWHTDLSLNSSAFSDACIRRGLRGFKRLYGWERDTYAAAFTLAYACFLRCAEFTWSTFDPKSTLQVGSVTWHNNLAVVRLARSKTDLFGQGTDLVVARTGCPVCPYRALGRVCAGRDASAPLFVLNRGAPFMRDRVITTLRELLRRLGLSPTAYAGHSFRRGAASWAAYVGAPHPVIQTLGCWTSDCYKRYIDQPTAERSRLAQTFVFGSLDPHRNAPPPPRSL